MNQARYATEKDMIDGKVFCVFDIDVSLGVPALGTQFQLKVTRLPDLIPRMQGGSYFLGPIVGIHTRLGVPCLRALNAKDFHCRITDYVEAADSVRDQAVDIALKKYNEFIS
jgi:hypothetical protein